MNIAEKAARIKHGGNGQRHCVSSRADEVSHRPKEVDRLRSLLRRESTSSRAGDSTDATTDYFASGEVAHHSTFPAPSGAQAVDSSTGRSAPAQNARAALSALTVPKLLAEIDARNDGRDEDDRISKVGLKDDLIDRLVADDERQRASV